MKLALHRNRIRHLKPQIVHRAGTSVIYRATFPLAVLTRLHWCAVSQWKSVCVCVWADRAPQARTVHHRQQTVWDRGDRFHTVFAIWILNTWCFWVGGFWKWLIAVWVNDCVGRSCTSLLLFTHSLCKTCGCCWRLVRGIWVFMCVIKRNLNWNFNVISYPKSLWVTSSVEFYHA